MSVNYCAAPERDGWLCILRAGHEGDHMSIDNRKMWEGTPGWPLTWPQRVRTAPPAPTRSEEVRQSKSLGYTGEICGNCGSPNTIRVGKCLRCDSCKSDGECG